MRVRVRECVRGREREIEGGRERESLCVCVCVYSQENRLLRRVLNEKGTPSSSVGPVQDGNLSTAHSRSHFCLFLRYVFKAENLINTWSYNKVRELAIVCLPWQHSTKALVWFMEISAFHSCVVVDLRQSLSEWHLLLSARVLVCRHENVEA